MKTFKELYPNVPDVVLDCRAIYISSTIIEKTNCVYLRDLYKLSSDDLRKVGVTSYIRTKLLNIFSGKGAFIAESCKAYVPFEVKHGFKASATPDLFESKSKTEPAKIEKQEVSLQDVMDELSHISNSFWAAFHEEHKITQKIIIDVKIGMREGFLHTINTFRELLPNPSLIYTLFTIVILSQLILIYKLYTG